MKIQIYSYFHIPYGSIPIVSTEWVKVLRAAGHDVKVRDYFYQDYRFESVKDIIGEHNSSHKDTLAIYFGSPSYVHKIGSLMLFKHRYKVGVFVTETELIRREKEALKAYTWTKIVVPSSYCKALFSPYANAEIVVVPHGIHPEFLEDASEEPKREKFTFLFVFNTSLTGGSLIRKNLGNLLSAFKSFRAQQDCNLYIKSSSNIQADVSVIERDNPGVKFDMSVYNTRELAKIYKSCHAYINASRAEGFGMTALEAMALGLPVASPNHSGLADFIHDHNAVVIPSVRSSERFTYATNDGMLWDVPVADITNAMARLYSEYETLKERAKEYSSCIKNSYTWTNCLKDFLPWINTLSTKDPRIT